MAFLKSSCDSPPGRAGHSRASARARRRRPARRAAAARADALLRRGRRGGLAVGVHTTQFAIRDPKVGLFGRCWRSRGGDGPRGRRARQSRSCVLAGSAARPSGAAEADLLARLGYHVGLLSLAALEDSDDDALIAHCRKRSPRSSRSSASTCSRRSAAACCSYAFWRRFAEIPDVVGDQDRAVQPLPDARRRPRRRRCRARRHRALHRAMTTTSSAIW